MVTDVENRFHCPVSCITRKQQKIGKHTENSNISNCYYEADKRRQQEILYKQSSEAKIKYVDGDKEQCWNFRTNYGGQEPPSRNSVVYRSARLDRLAESIPWLLRSLKIRIQSGSERGTGSYLRRQLERLCKERWQVRYCISSLN